MVDSMTFDEQMVQRAIVDLLVGLGEDVQREGLRETPARVARAWQELLSGYGQDIGEVLSTSGGAKGFSDVDGYDGMVVLSGYPLHSTCEHHLLPFVGVVDVGYIPGSDGAMVGLSKLGRLVDVYARRLQVQERLTQQIANALVEALGPRGVGVRVRAVHQCMACRGVRKAGTMTTETLDGVFRNHPVRDEFWRLCESLRSTSV